MIKAVVFDLDGTLYCGNKLIEGALETVSALIKSGRKVFYLTNNSGKTLGQIVCKLRDLGFLAGVTNTYCGSFALASYLAERKLSPVYAIGTADLENELSTHGIELKDSADVAAVAVGLDPEFSYRKISTALEAIKRGAKFIVANTDPSYPAGNGLILPGCGAMVWAIIGATGRKPDFIVGKPNPYMLVIICEANGLLPENICVVGDVPESDMRMASSFGTLGILFDPENRFPDFPTRVRELPELLSFLT